jgi:hypothetical protein
LGDVEDGDADPAKAMEAKPRALLDLDAILDERAPSSRRVAVRSRQARIHRSAGWVA